MDENGKVIREKYGCEDPRPRWFSGADDKIAISPNRDHTLCYQSLTKHNHWYENGQHHIEEICNCCSDKFVLFFFSFRSK